MYSRSNFYAFLVCLTVVATADFFVDIIPNYGCLCASILIHKTMLVSILHSRLSFFDTVPIGRILSRFSGDVSVTDTNLPDEVSSIVNAGFQVILSCI